MAVLPDSDPVFCSNRSAQGLAHPREHRSGPEQDPAYQAAQNDEEAAIQALGDMLPTSIAGAEFPYEIAKRTAGCAKSWILLALLGESNPLFSP